MENDLKGRIDRISLVSLNLAWGFMTEKYGLPETRPENPYHETERHLTIDKNGLVRFNTFFIFHRWPKRHSHADSQTELLDETRAAQPSV